jgi:ATP-dependent protease ClpP protease subunit
MIDTKTREIFIHKQIGPDWAGMFGPDTMLQGLQEMGPGDVRLRINSIGGSADAAMGMLEVLARHEGEVSVTVDSLAASAASLFPVAFPSTAAKHARIMIHNPSGVCMGQASDMRKVADILDTYRDSVATIYAQKMDATIEEVMDLLEAETWYSADAAQAAGLVDEVTETADPVAAMAVPVGMFKHTPDDLLTDPMLTAIDPETPKRVAAKLRAIRINAEIKKRRRA